MSDLQIAKLSSLPENFAPQYIKLVQAGAVTELMSMQYRPMPIDILRLSCDYYIQGSDMRMLNTYYDTGLSSILSDADKKACVEIEKEIDWYLTHDNTPPDDAKHILSYIHSDTKADYGCIQSVRRTLAKIRRLINTNCTSPQNLHWVTLTYAENMTDTERLYHDFDRFYTRFKRYCKKMGYPVPEYIAVVEPQGRGAWHMHIFFIWSIARPYIDNNSVLAPMWEQGFTKITACDANCDNVGAYFSAYLSDMSLDEWQSSPVAQTAANFQVIQKEIETDRAGNPIPKTAKKFVKGARLLLYPPHMRMYRTSRGVRQPDISQVDEDEAERIRGGAGRKTFESVVSVAVNQPDGKPTAKLPQIVRKEFFNNKRK